MSAAEFSFGMASYVIAAIAYLALFAVVLPSYSGSRQAGAFVAVVAGSALWAAAMAVALYLHGDFFPRLLIADALHTAVWVWFIAALLKAHFVSRQGAWLSWVLGLITLALIGLVVFATEFMPVGSKGNGQLLPLALLALPLAGLLGLEQLFRNAVLEQRSVLRLLCLGMGIIFSIDVFVFSQSLLFSQINSHLWLGRGIANVAAVPFLLLSIKRQGEWGRDVFVSRHVVFYTTTLLVAGAYLLTMAVVGYLIALSGVAWGPLLQMLFFFLAGGVLIYGLFSTSVRRRVKVFIAKHFYRNRYDYREEWLRLIETLAGRNDPAGLPERSVRALASIIGSPRGQLWWLDRDGSTYEPHGTWHMASTQSSLGTDDVLVRFLARRRWIIDTREYAEEPEKYSNAFASCAERFATPAIFVPLVHADALAGIARLERPAELDSLGYEDHDLLKTAGQQVAIFLQQAQAQDELSETRQFEAFSRLTAFLMHDLKNLIAQQELVVGNAQRFKHRPEFIDDAIRTIEASVQRMKKVLERLQSDGRHDHTSLVRVEKVLLEVCGACADRDPVPVFRPAGVAGRVAMDRERLAMAVTHAVRNAQDATPDEGRIEIRLTALANTLCVEVEDTGSGMDAEFLRGDLFKPFRSTKGAKGMGIGAYQIRETLRSAGGDVEVRSTVGEGTIVRMTLPVAASTETAAGAVAAPASRGE